MKHHTRYSFAAFSIAMVIGFAAWVWYAPAVSAPAAIADFPAPLPASVAQARVREAQARDVERRREIARSLDMTSPEALVQAPLVYITQSGYHISDRTGFLNFWRSNGGVFVFGYPISEEIVEDGRIVQYFERARFEYHPEFDGQPGQVQLALLGREATTDRSFPAADPAAGEVYFEATQHTLSGKFRAFWEKRGGLAVFGYPISEPLIEVDPNTGQERLVQYFERARFEHHPQELDGFYQQFNYRLLALHEVQLSALGRQVAAQRGYQFASSRQVQGAPNWASNNYTRRIVVNLTEQHLTAYEGELAVFQAPVATGRDGFNTPVGEFAIYTKLPMQTMTGSAGGETWNVPNIPWVQYVVGGVALHGTYWHDQWGTGVRMSHGCINLNIDDAQWLYEWADIGTPVTIQP